MALSDYIQIEYISNGGGAYIDTGVTGNRNYSYEMVCAVPNTTITELNQRCTLWGAEGSANKYSFGISASGLSYIVRYASSSPSVTPFITSSDPTNPRIIKIVMEVTTSGGNITITDFKTQAQLSSGTFSYNTSTNVNLNRNQYILALNNSSGGTPAYLGLGCRVYYFKIYNKITDTTLREFVPIRSDITNKAGMYDLINDVAYWSGNTYDFIHGPDISTGGKLWIRSSGFWLSGTPYIRQSGSWTKGTPYIRQSGSWTQDS